MYLALTYNLVEDYLARRPAYRTEHLALAVAAHERGEMLLAGALDEPPDRALLIWAGPDRAPVERFVAADPYVREGLVRSWAIQPWKVVIGTAAI